MGETPHEHGITAAADALSELVERAARGEVWRSRELEAETAIDAYLEVVGVGRIRDLEQDRDLEDQLRRARDRIYYLEQTVRHLRAAPWHND